MRYVLGQHGMYSSASIPNNQHCLIAAQEQIQTEDLGLPLAACKSTAAVACTVTVVTVIRPPLLASQQYIIHAMNPGPGSR
jgi:hypothetical protein